MKVKVDLSGVEAKVTSGSRQAEQLLASQIAKDTEPYVPFKTGVLTRNTKVVKNRIIYPGPYARYLYVGKKMVNARTGKGPMYIKGVGYRWPKGAMLKPTDEPLTYTQAYHPNAQAQWFEASKAVNIEKWERIAGKAIEHYGK